jgi:hypothetical protein
MGEIEIERVGGKGRPSAESVMFNTTAIYDGFLNLLNFYATPCFSAGKNFVFCTSRMPSLTAVW